MHLHLCNPSQAALFLDFDGTLADLAPRPEAVQVDPGLVPLLREAHTRLGGAVAIISGRTVAEIDHFLNPLQLAVAGIHGAQGRRVDGRLWQVEPPGLEAASAAAAALVEARPGLLLERKGPALALHYRQAPALESLCIATMAQAVRDLPGIELMRGKCVVEVKPAAVSKGRAIHDFMCESPFVGRTPVFIGDDITDEAGFETVLRLGGHAIKVGTGPSLAPHRLDSPAAVHAWLAGWTSPTPEALHRRDA